MLSVVPKVNQYISKGEKIFIFPKVIEIASNFSNKNTKVFKEWLEMFDYEVVDDGNFINFERDESMDEFCYKINVTANEITIFASTDIGQFYALTTLFQMIISEKYQECTIVDCPKFQYRSFSLDVSRHFFSIDEVKKLINQAAILKLNYFHFHVSDDRGYRLPSKKFPKLNDIGSKRKEKNGVWKKEHYSVEEIQELVKFANDRNIEIIPEIDIPGHSLAIIAAYPNLSCSKEARDVSVDGGVEKQIICGGNKAVREFLKQLLDEVCQLFPGKYIHLGGDEAPKESWEKCQDCQEALAQKNLANFEALQADLLGDLSDYLSKKGKEVICWNEAVASGELSNEVVVQYWDELHPDPSMLKELEKGRKLILSNIQAFYSDYGYGMVPLQATYEYAPQILLQKIPISQNILGLETPMWTEWVDNSQKLEELMFPRLVAFSEVAWTCKKNYSDFLKRLSNYQKVLKKFSIHYSELKKLSVQDPNFLDLVIQDALRMRVIDLEKVSFEEAKLKLLGWCHHLQRGYFTEQQESELMKKLNHLYS